MSNHIFLFPLSDEQELVQKRTFTKWINTHLAKVTCGFEKYSFLIKHFFFSAYIDSEL